ncbi:UNVERIFIED_CONTAM: hypothetical protein HDU68_004387, partial [Siphonaria sp. JEL0065]
MASDITTHRNQDFALLSELYVKNMATVSLAVGSLPAAVDNEGDGGSDKDDSNSNSNIDDYYNNNTSYVASQFPFVSHLKLLWFWFQVFNLYCSWWLRKNNLCSTGSIDSKVWYQAVCYFRTWTTWVHQSPTQVETLTSTLDRALELLTAPPAPVQSSPSVTFQLPESVQLT